MYVHILRHLCKIIFQALQLNEFHSVFIFLIYFLTLLLKIMLIWNVQIIVFWKHFSY